MIVAAKCFQIIAVTYSKIFLSCADLFYVDPHTPIIFTTTDFFVSFTHLGSLSQIPDSLLRRSSLQSSKTPVNGF